MPLVYVVAARVWKGEHFRTRYFRECVDGRPLMGEKQDAAAFGEEEAAKVCEQLNQLDAYTLFFPMNFADRPPANRGHAPELPRKPTQANIEEPTQCPSPTSP